MKLVEVTKSNQIFKIIGTLKDPRINLDVLKSQTESFISELESYREDIIINSPELKVADLLNENFIMQGNFPPILIEALEKVGGTAYTLDTFIKLGFTTPEEASFRDLNNFMYSGYSALRTVVLAIFLHAQKELAECPETEVFLPMFRKGIKIASKNFLQFTKYAALNNITLDSNSEDLESAHAERYNEWVEEEIEKVLLQLFERPMEPALVAPVGMETFLDDIKNISVELYDILTDFGAKKEPSIYEIRKPEFVAAIKKLADPAKRVAVADAVTRYNDRNITGKISANSQEVPVPAAVSILDSIIGFILYVGEVINILAPIVGEGSITEFMDSIEDERVKAFLDLVADELRDYSNPLEIAINISSIPGKLIPMYIFENPIFRITQVPELNELNANIYGLFFTGLNNEEE